MTYSETCMLEKIIKNVDMIISTTKTETVVFRGKEPVRRNKIVNNRNIIEQVKCFKYLGVDMSYEGEVNVQNKQDVVQE